MEGGSVEELERTGIGPPSLGDVASQVSAPDVGVVHARDIEFAVVARLERSGDLKNVCVDIPFPLTARIIGLLSSANRGTNQL